MAGTSIKTSLGYITPGKYNDMSEAVILSVEADFSKQWPNKTRIFESNGAYIDTGSQNANDYLIGWQRMNGTLQPGTGLSLSSKTYHTIRIYAFETVGGNLQVIRDWRSVEDILANPAGYQSSDNILYNNTMEQAQDDILERKWDDDPTTEDNPSGLNPSGGFFADTDPFDMTYLQGLDSIPDPEDDPGLDYSGFLTCYSLESGDLATLATTFFAPTVWDEIKAKLDGLANPLDYVVSAVELPFPTATGAKPFKLAGVQVGSGNYGVTTTRGLKINLGSVTLKEVWGSAIDYTNTSIELFLPYVGVKSIDPDIAINNTLTLSATVDTWTGDVLYLLHASNTNSKSKYFRQESVPYRWSGNCGRQIPISRASQNVASILSGVLGAVGSTATIAAGVATGNPLMISGGIAGHGTTLSGIAGGRFNPMIQSSGSLSGVTGAYDYQYPYLIVKRGVPEYPDGWREKLGAPQYQSFSGQSVSGFTQFSEIRLQGMEYATLEEKAALEALLIDEGAIL